MIVGVGIDVVPIERFAAACDRTPELINRLFTPGERVTNSGAPRSAESLAARFAAKEAVAKALGAPAGMAWHDAEVLSDDSGRPQLLIRGTVAERAAHLGVASWHVSLSHDGGIASAVVIADGGLISAVADGNPISAVADGGPISAVADGEAQSVVADGLAG